MTMIIMFKNPLKVAEFLCFLLSVFSCWVEKKTCWGEEGFVILVNKQTPFSFLFLSLLFILS